MKYSAIFLFCTLQFIGYSLYALEPTMHALVIGNSNYKQGPLKNPGNDALLMSKTLESIGFEVTLKLNLDRENMDSALAAFCRELPSGGVGMFYYAGHGVQDRNSRNYLIPIDAELRAEASVKYQTLSFDYVLESLEQSKCNLKILVLDCCRDNPFERSWGRSVKTSGLSTVTAPDGALIAYSTKEGGKALDGTEEHSPYTGQLAIALREGSKNRQPLVDIFRSASQAVGKHSDQKPYLSFDATMPNFYFPVRTIVSGDIKDASRPLVEIDSNIASPKKPPTSSPDSSMQPDAISAVQTALLSQAKSHEKNRQFTSAIQIYSQLISDPSSPKAVLSVAYRGRGTTYASRRSNKDDLKLAIQDLKAAGDEGVVLTVLNGSSPLKVETSVRDNVNPNDVVMVTETNGDWVWVKSVQGNSSRQGWVTSGALLPFVETKLSLDSQAIPKTTLEPGRQPATNPSNIPSISTLSPSQSNQFAPNQSNQFATNQPNFPQPYPQLKYEPARNVSPNPSSNMIQSPAAPMQSNQTSSGSRPRNAWETPEWEPAWKAREMKAAQEAWDKGNRRR